MVTKENVEKIAEQIIDRYNFDYPLNIEKLTKVAKGEDINVIFSNFDYFLEDNSSLEGALIINDKGKFIIINDNPHLSERRKLFTFAHELGHYFLHAKDKSKFEHQDTIGTFRRDSHWDFFEYEANQFAAELLMPRKKIEEFVKGRKKETIWMISDLLAKIFNVSSIAMKYRLKNLGYIPQESYF